MTKFLASFVTFVAAFMAAVAAWDRGGTIVDRTLLIALSVVIIVAVHLLPAITRRGPAWIVWIGCLVCAIYGHMTFFTNASLRAGDARAQASLLSVGTQEQIATVKEALERIQARPITVIAGELAQPQDANTRYALRLELTEAKKAEKLQAELVRLSSIATEAAVTNVTDPVISRVMAVTGLTEAEVMVTIGLISATFVELFGVLLWYEVFNKAKPLPSPLEAVTDPVREVQQAVSDGTIRATVAEIRAFVGCSQQRAQELRRMIGERRT